MHQPPPNSLPTLALHPAQVTRLLEGRPPKALLRHVIKAVTTPPYLIRLTGLVGRISEGRQSEIIQLLTALSRVENGNDGPSVSFTDISIQPEAVSSKGGVTRFSRSEKPLLLHTDSSYKDMPDSLMGFQCIESDQAGGISFFCIVDKLVEQLSAAQIDLLSRPIYPYRAGKFGPILWQNGSQHWHIRYYRQQLVLHQGEVPLPAEITAVLDQLDALLLTEQSLIRHTLQAGEMILFNNLCCLHGRSALDPTSQRLLFRGRISVDLDHVGARLRPWPLSLLARRRQRACVESAAELDGFLPQLQRFIDQEDYEAALRLCDKKALAKPKEGSIHFWRAVLFEKLNRPEAYQAALAKATGLQPFSRRGGFGPQSGPHSANSMLLVRSFLESRYVLRRAKEGASRSLKQGHFSLSALLNPSVGRQTFFNLHQAAHWPDDAPKVDLVVNTLACGDRMQQSLTLLHQLLPTINPRCGVINPPDKVLMTTREMNANRLQDIKGILFPKTLRLLGGATSSDFYIDQIAAAGLTYPVILRPTVTHTGKDVHLATCADDVRRYFQNQRHRGDFYAIAYIDSRREDGLYNKNRLFCIDGRWYPVASLYHDQWNIHSGDRYSVMSDSKSLHAAEQAFLEDLPGALGPSSMQALSSLHTLIGLDFFGIDCTQTADGRLLIFECNPAMRHNFDHAGNFPYTAKTLKAISVAFSDMVTHRLAGQDGS